MIGDVLVTTPLAYSIKQKYPDAIIDYLVFQGTDAVLEKNRLIRNVITVPRGKPNARILASLFKKYDIAIAACSSDRTIIASAIAGKRSVGFVLSSRPDKWKKLTLSAHVLYSDQQHVVHNLLSLLTPLGIPAIPKIIMEYDQDDISFAGKTIPAGKYILLHPYSRNRCKFWPAENWGKLAGLIQQRTGCRAVFTRTPATEDGAFLEEILSAAPEGVLAFKQACSLNQLAAIIKGSSAYVGIDTAVTHISAAVGTPTIAILGPTLTRYWAPLPCNCAESSPFEANQGIQRSGNVTVVQKEWQCIPCNKETCSISKRGVMECLVKIGELEVMEYLKMLLK